MKFYFLLILFVFSLVIQAQNPYPQDYFNSPLKQTLVLSGTFAELRSNHFHSGLDLKTNGKQGIKVYTSAMGYVSRIKVSRYGYGKALYITHPNGYTSVYAHLQKYAPKIEAYVKDKQYHNETFEIELFPSPEELKISTDDLVGYSGNTGGSSGPHLHFEIRDPNQRPMNPMLFGLDVKDTTKPEVYSLFAYPLSKQSHVNHQSDKTAIRLQRLPDGDYKSEPIVAYGDLGFGIIANDRQDYASNKNGISKISTSSNGKNLIEIDFKRFSFDETKHINRYIDYAYFKANKRRIQKLFIEKNNPLSLFQNHTNNGVVTVVDSTNFVVLIRLKDYKDNTTTIHIPVSGSSSNLENNLSTPDRYTYVEASKSKILKDQSFEIEIPANTFYDDVSLDYKVMQDTLKLHSDSVPLQKYVTLTFDASHQNPTVIDHLFIGRVSEWGKIYPMLTKRKGTFLSSKTKSLGTFTIGLDNQGPEIKPKNFKHGDWMSNYRYLKLHISDDLTGIKNYRATINDRWILMEYDPKTNTLTHDFNDGVIVDTKNNLKLIVTDNVGNSSKFETTFYRQSNKAH